MGVKSSSSSEAKAARADEVARQERIRQGTSRINSIFDGGTYVTDQLGTDATYDPTKTYYNADGTAWSPSSSSSGLDLTDPTSWGTSSAAKQFASAVKDGSLYGGTATSDGFTDDYYASQRQAYSDYATPQLQDQYSDAQKELTYSLARGGNLNSSTRATKAADLQQLYDLNAQKVADDALSYETTARTSVEDARANLITTLNATGDAEQAASSALARSTALSQPTAYSPLSQLFTDFTGTLGIQAAAEKAAAASGGSYSPTYNTGLFGNTGRVVVSK